MITRPNFIDLLKAVNRCTNIPCICNLNTNVPTKPHINDKLTSNVQDQHQCVDLPIIELLERLSLVNFGNVKGINILESSIKFAEKLTLVETSNVKPLASVLESENLHLRDDNVTDGHCRNLVMCNAKVTVEEYFIAPPGNIPLEPQAKELLTKEKSSN